MGVRAVVAAGWAVRDDAALVFAEEFYDEMLNGATFGRALQRRASGRGSVSAMSTRGAPTGLR